MNDRPALVVLRALGLGDLLTAVPALRGLRRARPEHRIVLATTAWLFPLLRATGLAPGSGTVTTGRGDEAARPVVDRVVAVPGLDQPLPAPCRGADEAVNLHGRGPRSTALLYATGPRRLLAFSPAGPRWRDDEHEVARWCRLLAWAGVATDPADLGLDVSPRWRRAGGRWAGCTVVHPGATSTARRWPADRFAAVARHERAQSRQVVVTGGPEEGDLARAVAAGAGLGAEAVLAGGPGLDLLAGVVAVAGRVVCGDTGVAHLATALGTPSVVLFGPTPPALWGPPPGGPHEALWAGHPGDPHGRTLDRGLAALGVDDVLDALERLDRRERLAVRRPVGR